MKQDGARALFGRCRSSPPRDKKYTDLRCEKPVQEEDDPGRNPEVGRDRMKTCPDRGRLEQLLNNRLVDTELDELEQHVEACSACQQTLDELTEATNWGLEQELGAEIARDGREAGLAVDTLALADGAMAAPNKCVGRGLPTVAGYEIEDELGRGGMGVVYRARHIRLNRPCALKMILAGAHAGPDDVIRFVTEAEAIARIQHPSIVQIRHIGDADGLPFLELEYVGGGSLDQQLNGTPWPAMRAARLAEQVARGVAGYIAKGSSIATSSPRMCSWRPTAHPRSATSAWPRCWTASRA
jgi:hypothetical protein